MLESYAILDSPAEEGFDDIVRLASRLCAAPVALVSFVAIDRQWFKARIGFPSCETDLDASVCKFTLAEPDILVIPDLAADPRTRHNPLVTGEPHIRFYAGAPLRTPDGHVLGSLCVIDMAARPNGLTQDQAEDLRALARQVIDLLALRKAVVNRDLLLEGQSVELKQARRVEVLAQATAALLSATDPAAVLDPILSTNAAMLGFDRSYTYEVGSDLRHLRLTHALELPGSLRTVLHHLPFGAPLCGIVAEQCRPVMIGDLQNSTEPAYQTVRDLGLHAYAGFPVMSRGRLQGVTSFGSTQVPAFDAGTLAFFATIARLMSVAYERLDAENALRESDARSRLAQEAGRIGTFETDIASNLATVSPEVCRLFGMPVAPVYPVADIVAQIIPEDAHLASNEASRREGSGPLDVAYRIRRADDGALRWIARHASFVRDAEGHPTRLLGTMQDITARQHAESEARRLAAIVEQSSDFIGVTDLDGNVAWINEAGRRLVGLADAESARTTRIQDYFDPVQWREVAATVSSALEARAHWRGELRFRHFGTGAFIPVIYDVIGLRDATGKVTAYATVTRDITEQKRSQDQQEVLNQELAHRLKNTLAIVLSIATQTLRNVPDRAPVEAFEKRVHALSTAHDVLLRQSWAAAPAKDVAQAVLANAGHSDRIAVSGPDVELGPRATLSLSLLLHELATNAAKYGALSVPAGRVAVDWRLEGEGEATEIALDWTERGGPPPSAPVGTGRKGFGSRLISRGLTGSGGVDLRYPPAGFEATLRAPLVQLQQS